MLVAVKTDSVAQAMREKFVVWPVPGGGDDRARRVVYCSRKFPFACGIERGVLRFPDNFVRALDFVGWLAKNSGAGHVGRVALDFTAAIDQHHISFAQRLRLNRAVRKRSGRANQG